MSRASGSDPWHTVELRDDERVSAATRGKRLAQSRTVAIGAGQAVIDVGAFDADAERRPRVALRGEVLIVS
jgi:hypothetical protein